MEPTAPSSPTPSAAAPPPSGAPPSPSQSAPPSPSQSAKRTPPLPQLVTELRDLVVRYFREQTLVPLQKLGRYVGFGVLGSLLLGFGVVFLGMSGLRALQEETGDTFSGDWSWVPYLIMFVALLFGAGLVWIARTARRAEKEYR
ncbi:MAG TPA: hypothetical protein VFW97_20625 [Acidimicrobiia bacterium]|jgi:hypothetical protein|nr:hypothetical protein [Acidimicrobiia bacterium]